MRTVNQIEEVIHNRTQEIEALCIVADEEERALNEEEQKSFDDFHDNELPKLHADMETAKKRELARKRLASNSIGSPLPAEHAPAVKRRFGNISAFQKVFDTRAEAYDAAYEAGRFFAAVIGHAPSKQWCHDRGINLALNETTNTAGGFTVPDPVEAVVIRIVEENGVLRRFARPTVMSSETHSVPIRSSGLTVYYPGENTAITASQQVFDRALLTAIKYATITEVSSELNEDSLVSMANEVATDIGLAMALAEDTNGFLGDGTGTYGGVTGLDSALNANSVFTAAAGNISFATLDIGDFESTAALLPRFTGANPVWYINSAGYFNAMVRLMHASGGTPGSEVASGFAASFLGYPVVFTQVMPSAPGVSTNVCFFGDLAQSVYMGTRRQLNVSSDMGGKYFEADQVAIKGTMRTAITVKNQDGSSAGPVVALATPAS